MLGIYAARLNSVSIPCNIFDFFTFKLLMSAYFRLCASGKSGITPPNMMTPASISTRQYQLHSGTNFLEKDFLSDASGILRNKLRSPRPFHPRHDQKMSGQWWRPKPAKIDRMTLRSRRGPTGQRHRVHFTMDSPERHALEGL